MVCGVPVASNAPSIPEVGRGDRFLIPMAQIVSPAILRVMGDELVKGLLAERGLLSQPASPWPKAAMETWMVINPWPSKIGVEMV